MTPVPTAAMVGIVVIISGVKPEKVAEDVVALAVDAVLGLKNYTEIPVIVESDEGFLNL